MLSVFKKNKVLSKSGIRKIIAGEFDEQFYKEKYDFLVTELEPLDHFIEIGWKGGFDPNDWFSVQGYLDANSDVAAADVNPFVHYLRYGRSERRPLSDKAEIPTNSDLRKLVVFSDVEEVNNFKSSRYYKEATKILNSTTFDLNKWEKWSKVLPKLSTPHPTVKSFVEIASSTPKGTGGILIGWLIQEPDSVVWVEDDEGNTTFFDNAYRRFRADVYEAFLEEMVDAVTDTGFLLRVVNLKPGQRIHIKALSASGVHETSSMEVAAATSDPKKLAEWLFSIDSLMPELPERFIKIDWPIIEEMMMERQISISHMPIKVDVYGAIDTPSVSVVVPLYGRIDFIEGQMVSFVQDQFIKESVEIIYVIDDPSLVEQMKRLAENLYRLYQVPFKVVFGEVNRGFSGANNLGATQASGEYLLFLNSDVFPKQSGWLEQLVDVLENNSDIGVVAPRLLFADGSIQHAGMEFKYRSDLGVWINHHPNMGLDPELDPHKKLVILPAVTGACMLISRVDFDAIDGWDTGYLIGDFEDSDFCMKLQETGKKCAYLPTVELTHLERQSFGLTGTPDFRTKVVILNATRHQNKWGHIINSSENSNKQEEMN